MSNSQGSYAVPENIRKMKPRGTMVKKIRVNHFFCVARDPDLCLQ